MGLCVSLQSTTLMAAWNGFLDEDQTRLGQARPERHLVHLSLCPSSIKLMAASPSTETEKRRPDVYM